MNTRARALIAAALLTLAVAAATLRASEDGSAPDAAHLSKTPTSAADPASRLASGPLAPQKPSVLPAGRDPSAKITPIAERGVVEPDNAQISSAERSAKEEAHAAEASANRQRLLFKNLSDLSSAAERAEREGNPTYAAALRRRAEILGRGLHTD